MILNEILAGSQQAFRTLVPKPYDRIPVTPIVLLYATAAFIPFTFLAYLARRPDTYIIRLLLLPIVVSTIVKVAFGFAWTEPALNVYNWGQCLLAEVLIGKALEYALTKEGMLKKGEIRPGTLHKSRDEGKASGNGSSPSVASDSTTSSVIPIPPWVSDAASLMHTTRGLSYQYSRGAYVPHHTRPLERKAFLQATFRSFLFNFLALDLLESTLKLFPGVGSPSGGSMFYPSLPLTTKYIVSTTIHMLTGSSLLVGFGMVYDLVTFLAIMIFGDSPLHWPPVIENPWISQSMHEFWGRRWHQLLRQTFLVYGGYPFRFIFKHLRLSPSFGMLLGSFLASGLFHECSIYAMGKGFSPAPIMFFMAQVLVMTAERLWRRVTGRRVGGRLGNLWVYFVLFFGAQPMVDSWHQRGLGGGMVIPPFLSPTRLFLVPLLQKALHSS